MVAASRAPMSGCFRRERRGLAELLPVAAADAARQGLRVVLALDGVYSMDGDVAPLPAMARLARNYEAIVLLDDAHGFATSVTPGAGRRSCSVRKTASMFTSGLSAKPSDRLAPSLRAPRGYATFW